MTCCNVHTLVNEQQLMNHRLMNGHERWMVYNYTTNHPPIDGEAATSLCMPGGRNFVYTVELTTWCYPLGFIVHLLAL